MNCKKTLLCTEVNVFLTPGILPVSNKANQVQKEQISLFPARRIIPSPKELKH